YETINANDIPARATAAVESGTGPDVFQLQWNQAHLYAKGLENQDKLAAELGSEKTYGYLREASKVEGVYRAIPFVGVGNAWAYRKDYFAKAGAKVPNTWEEFLAAGKKLKAMGKPVGQTLGHTFGDAPAFAYPLLWSFGGMEVDSNKKVAINSAGTKLACEFLKEFWNSACDPNGLAWDDSSNNRAYFAETVSTTQNGASIYFVSRNTPEKAPPGMADNTGHFLNPAGPSGQYHTILSFHHAIGSYSKNKEAAAEFIKFIMAKENYEKYITLQKGYGLGATPDWEDHPFWKQDAALEPFRLNAKYGRNMGYSGPYGREASEVQAKYIIIDLFARVAKGDSVQSSIDAAEKALKEVYGG
ncbi:MAG: extracellular solute-binding protein, partial [Deltaproteobacteria bacterium]|nr:extracellular solute-binding protein [Deltaproteobacteria bacterium]